MLELKNIFKSYDTWWEVVHALNDVSIKIEQWDFVAVMGPSGSWKSTLMNIIWMLDIPSWWFYSLDNQNVENLSDDDQANIRWRKIWFIFQGYNLISRMSIVEQVMLPLVYQWVSYNERFERAKKSLEDVWLWTKLYSRPNELSWWQQQRVAIARAMVVNPVLILADEPTWALDSKTWNEVMHLFQKLNEQWKTIILITHAWEIAQFAKRTIHIRDWKILE